MYVIVCYDVVGDRQRARLLKRLKGFLPHVQKSVFEGVRQGMAGEAWHGSFLPHVQKSVFEGELSDARLVELRRRILDTIDPSEDTVRIYQQCGRCIPATEILGVGVYVERGDADEVI